MQNQPYTHTSLEGEPINPLTGATYPKPDPIAEAIKEAASLIAEAIHANAEATVLLARATAGEFEPGDEPQGEQYLDGTPK